MSGQRGALWRPGSRSRDRSIIGAAAAVAIAVFVIGTAALAGAQGAPALTLRGLNTREPGSAKADLIYTGPQSDIDGAKITVNGKEMQVQQRGKLDLKAEQATVAIVLDTGRNLSGNAGLDAARQAIVRMIDGAPEGVSFGVFVAANTAVRVQDFTTNRERVKASVAKIGASPDAAKVALYEAIRQAANPFQADGTLQPNILVITGDDESASLTPDVALKNARGAVTGSGATLFVAEQTPLTAAPLDQMVADAGGMVRTAADAKALGEAIDALGTAATTQQYRLVFDTGLPVRQIAEVGVTVGAQSAKASVVIGDSPRGYLQLNPKEVTSGGGIPLLDGPLGLVLVIVFTLVGAFLFCYALTLLMLDDDSLSNVLQPYADGYSGDDDDDEETGGSLGRSALIQRAVELTEQVASSQGYLTRAEGALERANIALRAGEALTVYLGIVIVATLLGLLLSRSLLTGVLFGFFGAFVPIALIGMKAKRRRKHFLAQLPDTLQLLSGTLRAGYSLMQGIEAVSQEVEDPMGLELRRVITEARLGRPVEESLDSSAERMDSPDFAWAVMAIRIQREVGGNLAELLLTVAETMTARERLRRDVAALVAEGKMSAYVLGALPPGLGVVMFIMNPEYTGVLFKDTVGIILIVVSVVAMLIGFAWMKKIINIEI